MQWGVRIVLFCNNMCIYFCADYPGTSYAWAQWEDLPEHRQMLHLEMAQSVNKIMKDILSKEPGRNAMAASLECKVKGKCT